MDFRQEIRTGRIWLDGGTGTLLQAAGLQPGELPERWNLTHPEQIRDLHRQYFAAGSRVVTANTFGANTLKFSAAELDQIIAAAIGHVRAAAAAVPADPAGPRYAALDIGPLGRLLQPYGDLPFEQAVEIFAETVRCGVRHGADLILIETMNDSYETKAAVLAAKENADLPIVVSNAYGTDGKLMTGADPQAMVALLEGLGVDALGANCSCGPEQLRPVVAQLLQAASVPVLVMPNAGLPRSENGKTVYDVAAEDFAAAMAEMARDGARLMGGCCGTTPEFIARSVERVREIPLPPLCEKKCTVISSYTHAVCFGEKPLCIGERINPTGKKRFRQALLDGDTEYALQEGLRQQQAGVPVLDVNVGVPGLDEAAVLGDTVQRLQAVIDLPLQIDTSDPAAMERALRLYNGKALINSVNGKQSNMRAVFPLVKKYGGVVVALTLDEDGIPETAEGRVRIAEKILRTAAEYGIAAQDVVVDPLCLSVSAEPHAAEITLQAVARIRRELGVHTVLGVSNVSFGLPLRDTVNAAFFAAALENGLSAAIMNPFSEEMQKAYRAWLLLHGMDENCAEYLRFAAGQTGQDAPAAAVTEQEPGERLRQAIERGLTGSAADACEQLLLSCEPLQIIREQIVPALDSVGKGFEQKKIYLPQLLMSADAAKAAFERIKAYMAAHAAEGPQRCAFVIATVQGDIHDIGKNIVKVLLENYGFRVIDLGKDVPPETVVRTVAREKAPLCGLSALMTTTVPAMEQTIRLLREQCPFCKIVVGGAVLTAEYAAAIGADRYAADAMETVRYAEEIEATLS